MDPREGILRIFIKQHQGNYLCSYVNPSNFIQLLDENKHFNVSVKLYCNVVLSFHNFRSLL